MSKTTTTPAAVAAAGIQMPDLSAWAGFDVQPDKIRATEPINRVLEIDYEVWAVAVEPTKQKPERLEARAKSLEAKGFRELTGRQFFAHGVDSPVRVWVMPRHLYEQRRRVRDQNLIDRVQAGLYPESALSAGITRAMRK